MVSVVEVHRTVAIARGVGMAKYPAPKGGEAAPRIGEAELAPRARKAEMAQEAAPRVAVVAEALAVMIAIAHPELDLPLAVDYRTVPSSSLSHS
jgi:hypothetical protein